MRLSTANMSRRWKPLAGAALVAGLWVLTAVIAFVPFDRDSPGLLIIGIALTAFVLAVAWLGWRRHLDVEIGLYAVLVIGALVLAYMRPLGNDLPADALDRVHHHAQAHDDRYAFAAALFDDVADRFTGPTREYLLQPTRVFLHRSAAYFWETRGYVPSHLQAQLYRQMLIASGRFGADEVVYRSGRCTHSPHGYLVIAHPRQVVMADPWAAQTFEAYRFGQVAQMPGCDRLVGEPLPQGHGDGG